MRKTVFTIDDFADAYIGYTSGQRWNGWATPYFEKEEAMRIMAGYNECALIHMYYDTETDAFKVDEIAGFDGEEWQGNDVQTEDGIKHLYGIGAYSWVWDDEFSEPIADFISEFFADYDIIMSKEKISAILQDFIIFKNVLIILRADETAEIKIQKLRGELKC